MYKGQVLTWHDTFTIIVHDEATRAYLYITIPILTLACPVAVACLTYQRFGNTPPSYVAVKDLALYDPYGRYSYSIWDRFPELKLLYDITTPRMMVSLLCPLFCLFCQPLRSLA